MVCGSLLSAAQDEKVPEKEKSYGKASLEFANNSVYLGRKDSVTTPYITPTLGYYDKSGFYIEGTLSYLTRSGDSRIDESAVNIGYDFSIGNFSGEITAGKFFYNSKSTNVKSEVKGDIAATASYDFGFIETSLQPGINFGTKNDYILAWAIDHEFGVADDAVKISPSFLLNGSTRNFYDSYYGKRKFKKKNGTGTGPTISASVLDASKFKLMDYELSLPISYTVKKLTFDLTPSYSIPVNPAVVTIVTKPVIGPAFSRTITEKLENTFYFSIDAVVKF